MLLTGMLTVFFFSKLWRKANLNTDLEFYELRYTGKLASFIRGFRAVYLGFLINIFIMATVSLAAIKISGILLGLSPFQTILIAGGITVLYSGIGGLKSVLITDMVQFFLSILGAVLAAWYALDHPDVGGLDNLISNPVLQDKLALLPDFSNPEQWIPLILIPFAFQWWSTWYPGAEPGGGGYIAQRMLAAKNENHAMGAVFFFNVAHFAIRPWPWIIVALASIIVFPSVTDIKTAFPNIPESSLGEDLAYPAMLSFLPIGVLGLVLTSLIAAYMSTISTHLNWGASYITLDFYKRFLKPDASQKEQLWVGRISTVLLMVFSGIIALYLQNALQAFQILLLLGAGTGLIYILRWYWKVIHPIAEIVAMISSFIVAIYFEYIHSKIFDLDISNYKLVLSVLITTVIWLLVAVFTGNQKEKDWNRFLELLGTSENALKSQMKLKVIMMLFSCLAVYSALFCTGYVLYGDSGKLMISLSTLIISVLILGLTWKKIKREEMLN
jgi:Na+/proline symporter